MIRTIFIYIIVLVFSLLPVSKLLPEEMVPMQVSDSGMGMSVKIERDTWVVLFNDSQEYYDQHYVELTVEANAKYDGVYFGSCYVTGNDKRNETFLSGGGDIYYLGGVHDSTSARLVFRESPNVDVIGMGGGWSRIRGTAIDVSQHEEEVSPMEGM
ncbi:hypothetical protein C6497_08895 [Candidatus Poribacteria bacterium]|nr:MAG: hypothetical protein C6497_08895 [Candidatus Poribacteria bacterium]